VTYIKKPVANQIKDPS